MSAIALVLISTEPGQEQQVVADLKVMREVSEAMVLFGEYDVYCKVVVDDFQNFLTSFWEVFGHWGAWLKPRH